MPNVCEECQKVLDNSNNHYSVYRDDIDEDELISWDDGILAQTDESIKQNIDLHNAIVNHFENCNNKGCKELMENWKPYEHYTDRNSMLTGKEPML